MEKINYLVDATGGSAFQIIGNYWKGEEDKAVILLHMMPATKESWNELAERLNKKGWHVLAIDLRGHGESVNFRYDHTGEDISYKDFTDKEHQQSFEDVRGARNFLKREGVSLAHVYVGGASIGANLALQYMHEFNDVPGVFLLSPGLNYKGIETKPLIEAVPHKERVLLVAAEDDTYSAQTVKELAKVADISQNMKIFESGGHGTTLFETHSELLDDIIAWLEK